jgi:type I restriction enzyme S subunit
VKAPCSTVGEVLLGIQSGKSVKTKERPVQPGEQGILKVSAVTWGVFRPEENKAILDGYDPGDCPRPMHGDLLISRANTRDLVGAPVLVEGNHPNLLLSDKLLRLLPDENRVERRYLAYALRSAAARRHFEGRAGGTSGSMTNVTQEDIRSVPLVLPPLTEQRRIADILDKADAIRRKRKEAVALTEELLRSAFLEMFGDPVTNSKGWPAHSISDLCESKQYGTAEKANSDRRGAPVLRMNNLTYSGEIDTTSLKWVELPDRELSKLDLRDGDVLFNRVNSHELVGKTAAWHGKKGFTFAGYLIRLRPLRDTCTGDYIAAAMNMRSMKRKLMSIAKPSINMANISGSDLDRVYIPVPPLAAQSEYDAFRKRVADIRKRHANALNDSEALFDTLVSRAFSSRVVGTSKAC